MNGKLLLLFLATALIAGCKKKTDSPAETPAPATLQHGILVLNEGLFNQNNSTLSWINTNDGSVNNSFFEQKTQRGLGDTGNDIAHYGNKIYVVVTVSSTVEILDATTGASLGQISMISGSTPKQPRSVAFYGSKAYVTCYDGFVDVIDTASLTITQRIPVGSNPEGLAVSNGKLYVANSGGLNAPNVDSTLSVIDLATHTEIKKITVGPNPGGVCADSAGEIYVVSRGDYVALPSRMHRIDTQTDTKVESFSFNASGITRMNDQFLITYFDHSSGDSYIGLFDTETEEMTNTSFINTTDIATLYGVHYSPAADRIYCSDANGYATTGFLRVYSAAGAFIQSYHVGLNPSNILVYE